MKSLIITNNQSQTKSIQKLLSSPDLVADVISAHALNLPRCPLVEYDCILLDMTSPRLDGGTLCQQLREQGVRVPILVVADVDAADQIAIALQSGANDFIALPLNPDELRIRVQAQLSQTENKPAEAAIALQPSEERLRLALDLNRVGMWEWDIGTGTVTWNDYSYRLLGYEPGEIEPAYAVWHGHLHPEDVAQVDAAIAQALATRTDHRMELRVVWRDGSIHWLQGQGRVICDASGQPERIIGISFDITDRRHLEHTLQASEARLSRILDNAIAAITSFRVYANRDWEYEYSSAGCERLYGYSPDELTDQHLWLSRVHPDDRAQILMPLFDDFFAERDVTAEYRFYRKDGSLRWFSSAYTSRQITADCWVVTTVNHDITDRKQAELALQQQFLRDQLIADIAQDIRRSLNLADVLFRTVERVRATLNTDRVILFRFRPNWQGDVIMESVTEPWTPILSSTIHDPCFSDRYIEPYRQGRIAVIHDISQASVEPCYAELLATFQVKANLVVPILPGDRLWGLLIVHHCEAPRQWQTAEIELLQQLATHVGIAIQQSELYEQTRQELLTREQMQLVLEESEERFRSLSAAAPIAISQSNPDGVCLYVNRYWQELSGLSFVDSLGQGWLYAVHPDDLEQVRAAWNAYLQGDYGQCEKMTEFRLLTPAGQVRWVVARAAQMRSATGDIIGHVCAKVDITDRKLAEQKVREQAALLDIASDAIFVRDLHHRIVYWNQGAERLYGWQAEAAIGRSAPQLLQEDEAQVVEVMQTLLEQGHWQGELRTLTQAHQDVVVQSRWTLVRDEAGLPKSILVVNTDMTEKKRLEAQFYHAQRQESLGTLTSGIAHDLNNLLTPILAISQLLRLQTTKTDKRTQEMLQVLEESAKRGANMVKQILTFTRGTDGTRVVVPVVPLLRELSSVMRQTLPKSIQVRPQFPSHDLASVFADPTHLHQVFMNLCVNARDAMPEGGTLTLSVTSCVVDRPPLQLNPDAEAGAYVLVTIADTGTGIPPEVRDRIFDPFFTTKPLGQGTGLGLSTALGIVKSYGGFLQVDSQIGQGSQFKVYLPTTEQLAAVTPTAHPLTQGQPQTILIVDDDDAIRKTNQTLLASQHYRTLVASDGQEGIDLYTQHRDEVTTILIDVMMARMDGITAIRHLRQLDTTVNIIAVSGLASNRDPVLAAGANTFLTKPYLLEDLLKALHR